MRRRRLPEHLSAAFEAFRALVPALEGARSALTSSVPGTRLPGRPLAETLAEFEERLGEVRGRMAPWRAPEVEDAWIGARAGLDEALARAERVRTGSPEPTGFEGLIGLVGDLLAPLEAFDRAADRFRELRRTSRRW